MRRDSNTCSTDTDTDTSNSHYGLCTGNGSSFPRAGNQWGLTSQLPPAASSPRGGGTLGTLVTCCQPRAVPSPPQVSGSEGHPARGGEGVSLTPFPTVVTVLHPPCHTGQVGKGQCNSPLCQMTNQLFVDPNPQEISEKLYELIQNQKLGERRQFPTSKVGG